jgi:hypothetical protein
MKKGEGEGGCGGNEKRLIGREREVKERGWEDNMM